MEVNELNQDQDQDFPFDPQQRIGRGRPSHQGERELIEDLQRQCGEMRPEFGRHRTSYNLRVCDMVAAAGMPPTGALALKIGRWGTNADVQSDVRAWYAALASEKAEKEIKIPIAARRQASALIEQLFSFAAATSHAQLQERLAPLQQAQEQERARADALAAQLASAQQRAAERSAQALQDTEQSQLLQDSLHEQIRLLQAQLEQAMQRQSSLESLLAKLREDAQAKERALEREISAAKQASAQAQLAASQQLLQTQQAAESDRRALLLRMDNDRAQSGKLVSGLQSELSQARERAQTQSNEISKLSSLNSALTAELAAAQQRIVDLQRPDDPSAVIKQTVRLLLESGFLQADMLAAELDNKIVQGSAHSAKARRKPIGKKP